MPSSAPLPPTLQTRLAPVCVAVAASGRVALFANAEKALGESHFLELRLDALVDDAVDTQTRDLPLEQAGDRNSPSHAAAGVLREAVDSLRIFCLANPEAAVLATCRRVAGGGSFAGSPEQQLTLLLQCAEAGAVLVDVELETLEIVEAERLARFGAELEATGAHLLVSAHDFRGTGELERTLARLRMLGAPCRPTIYKVVSTAEGLADNLRMLRFLAQAGRDVALVGMCMGAAGLVSRVLALAWGSVFTFAAAAGSPGTAPGQLSAATLLGAYRAGTITRTGEAGGTRIYGVAGNPVEHSLSPALHNAAFGAAGIDAVYLPLHTTSIEDLLALAEGLPLAGLSVTMPWKVAIVPHLAQIDAQAAEIGAVNTVVRRPDGSLWGANTDADAVVEPLRAALAARGIGLRGAKVLLLGAGGAARAAAFGLVGQGAAVWVLNRTEAAARALAEASGAAVAERNPTAGYDAVVHATSAGMLGASADQTGMDAGVLSGVKVVFEMVYRPAETPLVRMGISQGATIVYGLTMFVSQGARQWTLWTGQPAPEAVMREALKKALAQEPIDP